MLATCQEARTCFEFHSYLLHTVILTKPHDFVLGTIADIPTVSVVFLSLYLFLVSAHSYAA
jgi:hypothetical protein